MLNLVSLLSTITQSENEIADGFQEQTRKQTTQFTPRPLLTAANLITRPQNSFGIRPDASGGLGQQNLFSRPGPPYTSQKEPSNTGPSLLGNCDFVPINFISNS